MKQGKIYQSLAGFYDVLDSNGELYRTRARGNFRKKNIKPIVGDMVEFEAENQSSGYILNILPRVNSLVRPPIANTDQAFVITSVKEPDFSFNLLDKELVALEIEKIQPIIIFTKLDLLSESELIEFNKIKDEYENIGYDCILFNPDDQNSIDSFLNKLTNNQSVLMGQTGAGKSTLLNTVKPDLNLMTNEISQALNRGKHTTRKVSLIKINNGIIADTPGFSSFETMDISSDQLKDYYPEMKRLAKNCRFRGCVHINEPSCAIKEAVESGKIIRTRYENYLQQFQVLKNKKIKY
ncbi:ribosome small subunit-dependent GTPase A [Lactobacillus sp. S2-2]|uniref:ribosome small subunit-dependent GTPase A n=1 Tax=Lactobacillus sp. S2-2 TaxID=2692917 RepID=UPI001F021AFD|nr:ribosome small subunit-dependent GTPase A [Lactobacillus sp. S2-2]MCF6515097.1 ribosome small subunit-dependent GTPase A [Lactobacillus sp. S2-2]